MKVQFTTKLQSTREIHSMNMASFGILSTVCVTLLFAEILAQQGCKYTSSSITCSEQSGKFLERDTSPDIDSINIVRCDMSEITSKDFDKFTNVIDVFISETELSFPKHTRLLSSIRDLHTLTIENTNVSQKVGSVFEGNHYILNLYLMRNEISAIPSGFVSHLQDVEDIDLSQNKITHIAVGAFSGLHSLRTLNLSQNRIGTDFDPNFLVVFAPSKCFVCRDTSIRQNCTDTDWKSCLRNEPHDQLWLIPQRVSIHLHENPICNIITEKRRVDKTIARENSTTITAKHHGVCKVYEQGHCFKHEGRRMFLLEACGLQEIPHENSVKNMSNVRITEDKSEANLFSTPLFWIWIMLVVGLALVVGVTLGALWYRKQEKEKPRSRQNSSSEPDDSVKVALMQASDDRLHQAVINENYNKVKELLKSDVNPNLMDANGDLPLHYAARSGNIEIVKELMKKTEEVNATNKNSHAAIHAAIARGHKHIVQYLLKCRADPNIKNKYGNSPLSQACKEGHTEIVRLLLNNGANLHHQNLFEEMPVHHAARRSQVDTFKLLCDKGANITAMDKRGYTPLHYAARKGSIEIARLILDRGESVNVRNVNQNTPLHKAAKNGCLEMILFLVERNADIRATNFKGQTPKDVAREQNHTECWKFLEQQLKVKATSGEIVLN